MNNRVFTVFVLMTMSLFVSADDHGSDMSVTTYYNFSTSNQSEVVAAITKFANSDCRKEMPARIRVMQNHFNGYEEATHTVLIGYESTTDMQKSLQLMSSCDAMQELMSGMAALTKPVSQSMAIPLLTGGDVSKDTVYMVWQLSIDDEAIYLEAYGKLMKAQIEAGIVNGGWGLMRMGGGADSDITHIAYSGAQDLTTLLQSRNPSPAFAAFQKTMAEVRTVTRLAVNFVMADL